METRVSQIFIHLNKTKNEGEVRKERLEAICSRNTTNAS